MGYHTAPRVIVAFTNPLDNPLDAMRNTIGLLLLVLAYGLLYPGLTEPVLSLSGIVDKADMARIGKDIIVESPETPELLDNIAEMLLANMDITGSVEAYQRTRSILGTIRELQQNGYLLVAFLVGLFSIIIPLLKGVLMMISYFPVSPDLSARLRRICDLVSKWSMADVFVIGIFVAFLAANAVRKEAGLLSFEAELGRGFYFFLGYCLLSILASQILASRTGVSEPASKGDPSR